MEYTIFILLLPAIKIHKKKYLCIHHSRMPSAFLLRNAHHAMHDIFFCASLQVYTALNRQPKL